MASQSPLQSALASLGARPDQEAPVSGRAAFDQIARRTGVPANVLAALDEVGGGSADENASALADAVAKGASIEEAISSFAGDPDRGHAILERAYEIADSDYTAPPTEKAAEAAAPDGKVGIGEAIGGLAHDAATGAVRGAGSAVTGLGVAVDEILRYGADPAADKPTIARAGSRTLGDAIAGVGDSIAEGRSEDYRARRDGTQISGSLTDPSSWSLGDDPSIIGLLGIAAEGVGSMAPLVAAPHARAAAVMGGLMSGGEGAQNGRAFVEDAAKTVDAESGRPEIEKLPVYKELIGGGMSPADATEELARRAENDAGFRQGLIGSVGGAATNRIMRGAEGWIGQGGRLTRAMKKAGAGAAEEGVQEAAEGIASATGINAATGAETDPLEDSFGNFLAGAMAGGGIGAVAGALTPGTQDDETSVDPVPESPPPLGLPAPDRPNGPLVPSPRLIEQDPTYQNPNFSFPGLPAPDSGMGAMLPAAGSDIVSAPRQIGFDPNVQNPNWSFPTGSPEVPGGGGPVIEPAPAADAGMGAMPALPAPAAPAGLLPPPVGPMEAIAQGLAAAMPAPESPAPIRFPEHKAGSAIRLADPQGQITDAVFMGETDTGARIRVQGQEVDLTPAQFDAARDAVPMIEAQQKAAEEQAKAAQKGENQDAEPASAPEAQPAAASPIAVGPHDDQPAGSQAPAQDGSVEPQGRENVQAVDQGGMPGDARQQPDGLDRMGNVGLDDDPANNAGALSAPKVDLIREKAAVLRGVPKENPPDIPGISLKWDEREGGFVFSRKHVAKVEAAVSSGNPGSGSLTVETQAEAAAAVSGQEIARRPVKQDKAITARGRELPVEYAVVELDDLTASQLDDGRDNPDFPQELQPRDRSGNKSQEQIRKIASDIRPALLGESPQASAGAPIIAKGGAVISGNGRTLALRRAYAEGKAGEYAEYLRSSGYPVEGMRQPVLVRTIAEDMDMPSLAAVAREANERDTATMSASEQAMADAKTLNPATTDLYRGGDVDAASNRDFVRSFLGRVVAPAEIGNMIRDDGSMTQDAVRRVQAALLARAYGDADLVGQIMESTDSSIKAIGGALMDVAGRWAQMRDAAGESAIAPDMDTTAALLEAVRLVDRARRAGRKVDEFIGQGDMFSGDSVSPMARAYLSLMFRDAPRSYGLARGRDKLASGLRFYADEALKTSPGADMFGGTADPQGTAETAKGKLDGGDRQDQKAGLFAPRDGGDGEGNGPAVAAGKERGRPAEPANPSRSDPQADQGRQGAPVNVKLKAVEIDPLGYLRPGYERLDVNGKQTTTQTRMTDDGYVVVRETNKTTIRNPKGMAFFAGAFDVAEAKVDEAIANARKPSVAANLEAKASQPKAPKSQPAAGILSSLTQDKQDRAAELKARLAAKARGQASSGLDPEYITLGGELVALYIEAGTKRFGQMLRDFAETTGLSLREAQAPMPAAYNHVRDDMDLNGDDVSGMDDAAAVMAEVRAALAEQSLKTEAPETAIVGVGKATTATESTDNATDTGPLVQDGSPENSGRGNRRGDAPVPGPQRPDRALADEQPDDGGSVGGSRRSQRGGNRSVESGAQGDGGQSQGRDGTDRRPRGSRRRVADSGTGGADQLAAKPAGRPDYVLTDPERIAGGGPKAKFARNRKAIEALRAVEEEGREPTPEELDAMAGYIGWGSFGQELFQGSWAMPRPKDGWNAENDWLRGHLGEAEWKSAQASIVNAHYTDPPTVQSMWSIVRALGFKGGRVLEPSMGIGNFYSMMPQDLAQASERTGIELDKLTGGMAKLLFPQSNVQIKGYQDSMTPDGFYDLVIGNWPFAAQSPADRRYDKLSPSLHDYFFLKALDQTRPGGFVIGVTSAGTMDKAGRATRLELAKKGDLVASFRLPSGAFKEYAGTSVVTDIIILQKRAEPNAEAGKEAWVDTIEVPTPAGTDVRINRYFAENPDNILGRLDYGHGTTSYRPGMIVTRADGFADALSNLDKRVPAGIFKPVQRGNEPRMIANMTSDRQGSIVKQDGSLHVVQGERLARLEDLTKYALKDPNATADREAQIGKLVDMRKAYGALIDAERTGADAEAARSSLKKQFDAFRKSHGPVVDSFGFSLMRKVKDPFAHALASLERRDGTPAAILTASTMRAKPTLANPTVADAYALNRNQSTVLDMDAVAAAAGVSVDQAKAELLASRAVLRTPGGGVEPRDTYLSGNVRRKLREAKAAVENGEADMDASITALEAVIPTPVPYFEIEARLGAPWVRGDDYRAFIAEMIGMPKLTAEQVDVRPVGGAWRVVFKDKSLNRRPEARSGYGVSDYPFSTLLQAAMGNRAITLRSKDEDGKLVVDEERSKAANAAATKIRERFQEWIWEDPERTADLEGAYNDMMRAIADPQFDGDFLTFPGMALKRGDDAFSLRKHQRDAIWRGVYNERGIYAHEVGTGKTYTMAGIAIESRRYGKAKKPLLLAHNANSASVAAEAQEMYPGASILYVDNMAPDEIETTMRRIASDDWDLIVMPHSVLDRVGFKPETLEAMAAEEIAALEQEALDAAEEDGVNLTLDDMDDADAMKKVRSVTAKNLVHQRNAIKERIAKSANRASRDGALPFEDLGVDMVLVDEAHEFKKPPISTRMQMKGLNTQSSDRSIALWFLTGYIKQMRGGSGVHVFTGTPITNTLNEIFNMMRYVMDGEMDRDGVKAWDMWFNTFADSSTDVEVTSSGEFESVTRLAQFVNVAELRRMAGQFLDIVFASDMPEFKPRETASGKTMASGDLTDSERDELLNGRSQNPIGRPYKVVRSDVGQMSPAQKAVMMEVVGWSKKFKTSTKKERRQMMLSGGPESPIVHEGIAAKASLDVRLYDRATGDHPDSKASRAVRNVMNHYRESDDGTQVIFVEQGYTTSATRSGGRDGDGNKLPAKKVETFSLVRDIVTRLTAEGIPADQIAVVSGDVSKPKRKEIADAVNEGRIRVVIGMTSTLGVGVNMQKRLRAMHHLDARWMPGDLEQRNGRGERQGNTWNTVLEYRYLTEGIDGRRWQVLAIKDRFIKAFLRANDSIRVIEGDAVEADEGANGDSIAVTLAEATGDPRLLQREKLAKDVERLEAKERQHKMGAAAALKSARKQREQASDRESTIEARAADAAHFEALREAGTFTATIGGKTYDKRPEAGQALDDAIQALSSGDKNKRLGNVQGFDVFGSKRFGDMFDPEIVVRRKSDHEPGRASLASIEATLRNLSGLVDFIRKEVDEARGAADRLEAQARRPFSQADKLTARRKVLDDLVADLEENPVPPPGWLRHGAPVGTEIFVNGKPREVQGHRWTDDGYYVVTDEGAVPYLEARAESGVALYDEQVFEQPIKDHRPDDAKSLRAGGAAMTPEQARAVNDAARAELEKVGLLDKIGLKVEAGRLVGPTGSYSRGVVSILRNGAQGWRHTLDHEIIHALRDPARWGGSHGLFTPDEWRALVRTARGDAAIKARVQGAYSDLDSTGQAEEMVAELYADWAQGRREVDGGPLQRALEAVQSFFRAMASAFRGEGFHDPARIMARIADGQVGGRGPDGQSGAWLIGAYEKDAPRLAEKFTGTLADLWGDMAPSPRRGNDNMRRAGDSVKEQRDMASIKAALSNPAHRAAGLIGNLHWKRSPKQAAEWASTLLTDAMGKDARFNALSLVPGRALFTELARKLPGAQDYLALKEQMDAMRNDWQVKSSGMVDKWTSTARRDPKANQALMELMHESTLAGLDPTKEGGWHRLIDEEAQKMLEAPRPSPAQVEWARITLAQADERKEAWEAMRARFDKLPKPFRELYAEIRDGYSEMADGMDKALIENIRAMSKVIVKKADREHRQELDRIRDEGLTGTARADAIEAANERRTAAHARAARGSGSRIKQMRQMFESNRLSGPYFPLARFGNYFVTIRDGDGKVTSFSRFETEREQKSWADQAAKDDLGTIQTGVLGGDVNLREQVDPRFLADVEELMSESGASKEMMDAVWQRWLETLPDQSVRTNRIHRKGRAGFNKDAIRAFASSMFHGAHQMARLQYGAQMEETLNEAEEQASQQPDANRAGFVVREMKQRHAFTMAPTNNPWVTKATGLAFVWYLGVSPAAAMVNLSQTTVVGVPLMAARYRKGGAQGAIKELSRASMDFMRGRGAAAKKVAGIPVSSGLWSVENSPNLTVQERAAMEQGYQRGVIDKTQAHDLASVADSGVEYNPAREKVMRVIGWGFHHTERFNREVTYLAAYRMAVAEGMSHDTAIESAAAMTWKVHFDYSNSSRPRAMTGDAAKVLTIFKNFQVNMLFRLFRDAHQALHASDAETKREARMQLAGVTLSLMAHAGIRGVWGYALLTTLLAWFMPGADDGDDIDEWLQDALLIEGDSVGTAAWNFIMGAALNGTPGHLSGIDLTNRIGMPELLMRSSGRDLEGKDQWYYLLEQIAGPLAAIAGNMVVNGPTVAGQAVNAVADRENFNGDELTRAVEKVVPTFARNVIKTGRYAAEGVTTRNGDPVVEDLNPYQLLMQLQGFTPAEVSEQYKVNNRLKNREGRVQDQRQSIMRQLGDAIRAGQEIPESALKKMRDFNQKYPEWPITSDALRQSVRARQRASERNEGGVSINPKIAPRLREELAPSIYR